VYVRGSEIHRVEYLFEATGGFKATSVSRSSRLSMMDEDGQELGDGVSCGDSGQ
jgi:hypothetical protein